METIAGYVNEDPLGFTKQTATMLVGLGAEYLIPEFKKRNISTQGLAALNKEDLITLGADETLADNMVRQLRSAAQKYGERSLSDEYRMNQLIKILEGGNQQLNLIQTFIAYAKLRFIKNPTDFVIDSDKNIRASEALFIAANCVIAEVDQLEKNYQYLLSEFPEIQLESKNQRSRWYRILAGIGLTAIVLSTFKYSLICIKRS